MKTFKFIIISFILSFLIWISFADNCIEKDFRDITTAKICVNTKGNEDNQYVTIEATCKDVLCSAQHCTREDGASYWCNRMNYNKSMTTQKILVSIKLDNMTTDYLFAWTYDFQNQTRLDDDDKYNNATNSSYIDASAKTTLDIWESTDLIIKTNKDYTWDIIIKKQYYSIWAWWQDFNGRNAWWKYTMKSSDNWLKILPDFVKFDEAWNFRLSIGNSENKRDSLDFTVNKKYIVIDDEEEAIDEEQKDSNQEDEDFTNEKQEDSNQEDEDFINEKQEELTKSFNDALNYGKEKNYDKAIEILKEIISKEWIIERDNYEIAKKALRIFEETVEKSTNKNIPELNKAISRMYENWLTIFNDPESFMAYNWLRRDEAAKFFVKYAKEVMGMIPDYSKQWCTFKDLDQAWSDLKDVIVESCQLWLFQWSKWKFMPTQQLTNAQAITVFMRLREWYKDESWSHFANNYYESAHAQWLLSNTPLDYKVNFDSNTTRWDVAKMLFRWKN